MSCASITLHSPQKTNNSPWKMGCLENFPFLLEISAHFQWVFGRAGHLGFVLFLLLTHEKKGSKLCFFLWRFSSWGEGTGPWDPRRTCSQIAGGDGGLDVVGGLANGIMDWSPVWREMFHLSKVSTSLYSSFRRWAGDLKASTFIHRCTDAYMFTQGETGAVLPWILQLLVGNPVTCLARSPWSHQGRCVGMSKWARDDNFPIANEQPDPGWALTSCMKYNEIVSFLGWSKG